MATPARRPGQPPRHDTDTCVEPACGLCDLFGRAQGAILRLAQWAAQATVAPTDDDVLGRLTAAIEAVEKQAASDRRHIERLSLRAVAAVAKVYRAVVAEDLDHLETERRLRGVLRALGYTPTNAELAALSLDADEIRWTENRGSVGPIQAAQKTVGEVFDAMALRNPEVSPSRPPVYLAKSVGWRTMASRAQQDRAGAYDLCDEVEAEVMLSAMRGLDGDSVRRLRAKIEEWMRDSEGQP